MASTESACADQGPANSTSPWVFKHGKRFPRPRPRLGPEQLKALGLVPSRFGIPLPLNRGTWPVEASKIEAKSGPGDQASGNSASAETVDTPASTDSVCAVTAASSKPDASSENVESAETPAPSQLNANSESSETQADRDSVRAETAAPSQANSTRDFTAGVIGCSVAVNGMILLAPGAMEARPTKKCLRFLALCVLSHHPPGTPGLRTLIMEWNERAGVDLSLIRDAISVATDGDVLVVSGKEYARLNRPVFLDGPMLALARAEFPALSAELLEAARA